MVSIVEIIHEIRNLDDNSVNRWIAIGLTNLSPNMLKEAVRLNRDPLELAEYLNLEHPLVKPIAKLIIKRYWENIRDTLKDPMGLYNIITKDPEKKKILDTDMGRKWLSYVRKRCYNYYYDYAWN